jgi:hypothetical protein
MATAKWQSADLSKLVPDALTGLISNTSTALSTMEGVLDTVGDALDVAKALIIGFPAFSIADTLSKLIDDFRRDFNATGVYYLPVWDAGLDELLFSVAQDAATGFYAGDDFYVEKITKLFQNRYRGIEQDIQDAINTVKEGAEFATLDEDVQRYLIRKAARDFWTDLAEDPTLNFNNVGNSWGTFIQKITRSFDDSRDPNRPQFISGQTAGVVFCVGAPTFQEFVVALAELARLFYDLPDLERIACACERALLAGVDTTTLWEYPENWPSGMIETSCLPEYRRASLQLVDSGTPPDWKTIQLKDVPPLTPVFEAVDAVLAQAVALLKIGSNLKGALVRLIDAIRIKVRQLQEIVSRLNEIISRLDEILGATGIYALFVTADGGNEGMKRALSEADVSNVPFAQPGETSGVQPDAYIAGCMLLAGTASITPFEAFFAGLADD